MKLIVMRHGEAEVGNTSDESRNLTQVGRQQAKKAGEWLAKHVLDDSPIDVALVSPFKRAQQTFECVQSVNHVLQHIETKELVPEGMPSLTHMMLDHFLHENPQTKSMMLVSHMPLVCYLLDELLLNHQASLFETASMAIIDYDLSKGGGTLVSFYHPCMMMDKRN